MDLKGKYECTLDNKGRIMLPSVLKKQMPNDAGEEFTVNRGFDGCLVLYPKTKWDDIRGDLKQLSDYDEGEREFKRTYLEYAIPVGLDAISRFLLTQKLLDWAKLKKDVILVGVGEYIEIWDQATYESRSKMSQKEFSTMAAKVMGKLKPHTSGDVS